MHHFTLEETKTVRTVTDLLTDLSNPPYTPEEYLSTLEQVGLVTFAQLLRTSGFMS